MKKISCFLLLFVLLAGCDKSETGTKPLQLVQVFVGSVKLDLAGVTEGLPVDQTIALTFSAPVNQTAATNAIQLTTDQQTVATNLSFLSDGRTVAVFPAGPLQTNTLYTIVLGGDLQGSGGENFTALDVRFKTAPGNMAIISVEAGGTTVTTQSRVTDVPLDLALSINFSSPVNRATLEDATQLTGPGVGSLLFSYENNDQTVVITAPTPLRHLTKYLFTISEDLESALGEPFQEYSRTLYTEAGEALQFPLISDEALLTLVQQKTFQYFWDFAHPASGMARERNSSGDIVTSGGSGFGLMAIIVGIERGFITQQQGLERLDRILTFLETADRFHGAWPHWMNGNTGDVIPFSANDNGGDLVETSFLMQGLLTFRQYLDPATPEEKLLIDRVNTLWETVEWDWYTREGQNVLYWHWSPDKQWIMNHPVRGYNEALITYFLAAASPTHSINASVYHEGWAANGAIVNNKKFYDITLPVGYDYGGPLFFAHYSFLALDPRNLQDSYANYWTQNVNHSLINHAHALANPKDYVGYSDANWGFTASDNQNGYSAHSPTNDLGVITPSAALSSFPFTPAQSMKALKFFYYTLGDRLWGTYGFYDAFNVTEGWTADSYLAIDQGPIVVMIENYRTGLTWDLFMSAPETQVAMDKLGFTR